MILLLSINHQNKLTGKRGGGINKMKRQPRETNLIIKKKN